MAATEAGLRAAGAIEVLYRDHVGTVYRYAYAVLGNHSDAEDVTQTTFVNALRALERGESPRKPENWLLTIAHNIVRQRWRHQQSRPTEVELDTDLVGAEDDEHADLDGIVRALQRIPPAQREALVMRELEGRSYQEIAQILDLTTSALETLLFRARRSLAEELENLVTCDRAEGAISRQLDGRLSRKERRRLQEHLRECPSCARLAKSQTKYRGALRGLALLPIPASLTLFKGTSSAAAAALPTIGAAGAGAGAGVGVGVGTGLATTAAGAGGGALLGGAAAKVAAVVAAAAVVGGGGYAGVTTIAGDTPPKTQKPAVTTPAKTKQATKPKATGAAASNGRRSDRAAAAPAGSKSKGKSAVAPGRVKEPGTPASPDRGRSADARQTKGQAVRAAKGNAQRAVKGKPAAAVKKPATAGAKAPAAKPKPAPATARATAKPKTVEKTAPAASQGAGKGRQAGKAAAAASPVDATSSRAGKAASSDLEAEEISGIAPAAADKPGKGAGGGSGRKTR